jgi:protein phosphatase
VKLLIFSDIHGNLDALHAIRESYDELWVLGDIVNYGPEPREALEAVRATASIVVQGNHDHAVGHCDDSRWSARFREVAEANAPFYLQSIERCSKGLSSKLASRVAG